MDLMAFLDRLPSRNFVLDGFPQTKKQAKIMFESFGSPLRLFYLEAEKDEVHNRIHSYAASSSQVSATRLKSEFDEFLTHRTDLQGFLAGKPFVTSVSSQQSPEAVFRKCRDELSPVVHFCNKHENKELCGHFIRKLEKRGFMYISLEKTIDAEISRGLELGQRLKESRSTENIFELLRRILYGEPRQNKKYVIANYPNDLGFLQRFPEEVCEFGLILHFTKTEGEDADNQYVNFEDEHLEIVGHYKADGRLIPVGVNDPGIVEFHSEKRNKYGLIIGPLTSGKTVLAKYLKKEGLVRAYFFDKFKEQVIKRLTKDDVTPDDVSLAQVLAELNKDMQQAPADHYFLLDGFNWAEGSNFETLIKTCGEPLFVLRLDSPKDLVVKRYMEKNGISEALSDEDNENLNKAMSVYQEVAGKIEEMLKENSNLTVFDLDVGIPEANTKEALKRIFRKRIILTRITATSVDQARLKKVVAWLCAKFDYLFVDMDSVMREVAEKNPFGVKEPQNILENIKYRVESNKRMVRNVLIYNYLQSDLRTAETEFYPNSKDEIFYLEQHIGKIRACLNFVNQPENLLVEETVIPKVEKPPVVGFCLIRL